MSKAHQKGQLAVNSDLFVLTYGAFVQQIIKDYEDPNEVNAELEKIGYSIGCRLIDEFLATSTQPKCKDFKEAVDVCAKSAFKMFLGVQASVTGWNEAGTECTLVLEFIELPDNLSRSLWYSNILCGVMRGSFEMVNWRVECSFQKDTLRGDETNEIKISLTEVLEFSPQDDD